MNGPYSRVYWLVMEDAKFDGIREDARAMGAWLICLITADMSWPSPAYVPPTVPRQAYARLVAAGLIDDMPGHRYRIHGLDAERGTRQSKASASASARWKRPDSERNANAMRTQSETHARRDEHRQDEHSTRAREGLDAITPDVAEAWEAACGRTVLASGAFAAGILDDVCRRHTELDVSVAIIDSRGSFDHVPSTQQLAAAVRNLLDPLPSSRTNGQDDAAAREAAEIAAGRKRVEATLAKTHEFGAHAAEPNPRCPSCVAVAS